MKLSYWDLDLIHDNMKAYQIKYQEIYNELFDHITTAIEERRKAGDTASLQEMYVNVVTTHFGGYAGIELLSSSYEKEYKTKVRKLVWGNFKYYLNIWTLLATAALVILSKTLPNTKLVHNGLIILLAVSVFYPALYMFIRLKKVKPARGKKSLVYEFMRLQALLPVFVLNAIMYLPQLVLMCFNDDDDYSVLKHLNPQAMAFVVVVFAIYALSCIRLCGQELKQFIKIENKS